MEIKVGVKVTAGGKTKKFYVDAKTNEIILCKGANRPLVTRELNDGKEAWIAYAWYNSSGIRNIRATEKFTQVKVQAFVEEDSKIYYIDNSFKWNEDNPNIKMTHIQKWKCDKKCMHNKGKKMCLGCKCITSASVIKYSIDRYQIYIGIIDDTGHFYVECEINPYI